MSDRCVSTFIICLSLDLDLPVMGTPRVQSPKDKLPTDLTLSTGQCRAPSSLWGVSEPYKGQTVPEP